MRRKPIDPVRALSGLLTASALSSALCAAAVHAQQPGRIETAQDSPPTATAPAPTTATAQPIAAPSPSTEAAAIATLPAPPALPAPESHAARAALAARGQVARGFAMEANFATRLVVVDASGAEAVNPLTLSSLSAGLTLGYKTGRVVLGVGFEYANLSSRAETTTAGMLSGRSVSTSSFLVSPLFQVALARSPDRRVELIGSVRIGLGRPVYSETREPATVTPTDPYMNKTPLDLKYELAPGVRFWAHPHFALTTLVGASGYYSFAFIKPMTGVTPTSSTTIVGINSLFASLGVLGVF